MSRALRRKARRGVWDSRYLNGHPDVHHSLYPIIMEAVARGLVVTSTTDGVHATGSFHYAARAVDFGRAGGFRSWFAPRLVAFQRHLHKTHGRRLSGRRLSELLGPSNRANRKWGVAITLAEGSPLETLHDNHVHVAI